MSELTTRRSAQTKAWPTLYKYTQKGQVQQWSIFASGDSFWTEEGIQDGKITTSLPTFCKAKNVGRANATTPEEQAVLEAQAKWQKKVDGGYNQVLSSEKKFLEPMLAFEYDKYPIDWEKEGYVYAQPKLDGLRAINENGTLMSRNGKPYTSTPHLCQGNTTLDGELYTHTFKDDFNKIVSLCKKQKPTQEELAESAAKVEYWVYDMPNAKGTFSERLADLTDWFYQFEDGEENPGFVLVPTKKIKSKAELDEFHAENLGKGYEGTIIRRDNAPYEFKRSKQLLKYKDFKDEEFKIVGYEEGEGGRTGTIGFFILQHDKNPDQTFKSNVKGNFDYLKQVWKDRDSYIGKTATVKYFNRTPKKEDGTGDVPRFPYIVKINREEYE